MSSSPSLFFLMSSLSLVWPASVVLAQDASTIGLLVVVESAQPQLNALVADGIKMAEADSGQKFSFQAVNFTRKNASDAFQEACGLLNQGQYSALLDMSWGGWIRGRKAAFDLDLPIVRVDSAKHYFVKAADDFLRSENTLDAALIFPNKNELDQALYYFIGNSFLRIIAAHAQDPNAFNRLKGMRPRPSNYVVFGKTKDVSSIFARAKSEGMLKRDTRWSLVLEDLRPDSDFDFGMLEDNTFVVSVAQPQSACCVLTNQMGKSSCDCSGVTSVTDETVKTSVRTAALALASMKKAGSLTTAFACSNNTGASMSAAPPTPSTNATRVAFDSAVGTALASTTYTLWRDRYGVGVLMSPLPITIQMRPAKGGPASPVGTWTVGGGLVRDQSYKPSQMRRLYRIGLVLGEPWTWVPGSSDPTGLASLNYTNQPTLGLQGYCVDLLQQLADKMDFDYEIVPSAGPYAYGTKNQTTGEWSGVVGNLISGEIDISVATLTMTTEREEVIDFVSPYFDQSGISILLRKKEPKQSIFKFMTVLKAEVWFGILAAVIGVSFLLWGLDRFSPYSYHNNKSKYPEGTRDFTFGESLWFALTSLTPQGGGECPKALSSRVLVGAYWLFIVLMLATFTANLAAFLTVERMQTTVQSLEELAKQSSINYTAMAGSPYMEYFVNMAGAEDELYKKWKEITLSSSADDTRYRVWDYPVREQYAHILSVVQSTGPVATSAEGFARVEAATQGDFALLHDAMEVRYWYYQNCNFTEIGEPFAEQPLAVAVQQGSHLQKNISRIILELQKERYFETLTGKYWSSSKRNQCPVLDDSQGITLRSLGGIFLATLVGLVLAMIVLAFEVWQQKRKSKNKVNEITEVVPVSGFSSSRFMRVGTKQVPLPIVAS